MSAQTSAAQTTTVITGGGSGIGKATALLFAKLNNRVFVGDLAFNEATVGEFAAVGITAVTCDVRLTEHISRLIQQAFDSTGRLDVLVNNAGVGLVKQISDVTEKEWDNVLDTNLKAAFFGCKAAVAIMSQQDSGGSIVNVASNAGLLPRAHDPVYSISKMALVALTRSLALCHSPQRIRVNCVCPGPVQNTQLIAENFEGCDDHQQVVQQLISASPLANAWGRMVTPEEIAETIAYLASDSAQMVTGTSIAIDGGKSLGVPPQRNV